MTQFFSTRCMEDRLYAFVLTGNNDNKYPPRVVLKGHSCLLQ